MLNQEKQIPLPRSLPRRRRRQTNLHRRPLPQRRTPLRILLQLPPRARHAPRPPPLRRRSGAVRARRPAHPQTPGHHPQKGAIGVGLAEDRGYTAVGWTGEEESESEFGSASCCAGEE